jgi:APA family basic amino acid/polyamine antiporter
MPALGLVGCAFMVYAAFVAHGAEVAHYLIVFAVFMIVGNLLYHTGATRQQKPKEI